MSFIKSKHSGWTHELRRTPFGGGGGFVGDIVGGIGDAFSGVGDIVDDALVGLDETVGDVIPGGWTTVGAAALAAATMGGSLGATGALEAGAVASADMTAAGLGFSSAAEAISAGAITAAELGLPAAVTAADLAAVTGSASAGWLGLGVEAGVAGGVPFLESIPWQLADGTMGSIQGGNILNAAGEVVAQGGTSTSLGNILGYAKTAAPIVGGITKLMGGYQTAQAGRQVQPGQADPFSPYRSQYAAQLSSLMNDPNTVAQTPGYQFNLAQGLQGLQAQQAAQGRLVSGGAMLQGQQFGQQLAGQTYNQQIDTLARLSGAYQSPATGAAAMQSTAFGNAGATGLGYNAMGGAAGQIGTGLLNLYENYNRPSPSPTA